MQELTERLIKQAVSKEKGRGVIEAGAKGAGYLAAFSLTVNRMGLHVVR